MSDESRQKMYMPRTEYESLVQVDNGRPLTDLFPDGILVTFRGDEIESIESGKGILLNDIADNSAKIFTFSHDFVLTSSTY